MDPIRTEIWMQNALMKMEKEADRLMVMGVAAVCVKNALTDTIEISVRKIGHSLRKPIHEDDKGDNLLGLAFEMIALMERTSLPSGETSRPWLMNGETIRNGGVLRESRDYVIYVAFAGGLNDDVNVRVAEVGLDAMFSVTTVG